MSTSLLPFLGGVAPWAALIEVWEIHPILIHFPIAFLLGGVFLDLYAWWRRSYSLNEVATGLLIAGVLTGVPTALAGWLAMETVPAHTEEAHRLMYWHMYLQLTALALFTLVAWVRWQSGPGSPGILSRVIGWIGAVVLTVGGGIGGYMVYHGGTGIMPRLLAPWVKEHHHHGAGHEHEGEHKGREEHKDHEHDGGHKHGHEHGGKHREHAPHAPEK